LNRLITRLDEVPPLLAAHDSHRIRPWCNLYKRVRRSLSSDRTSQKACAFEDGAVRKDSAAHVSLSSIQFSKSPEPKPQHPPSNFRFRNLQTHPTTIRNRRLAGC